MNQVLTPEERAALWEGLREAENRPGSLHGDLSEEIRSGSQDFPERCRITRFKRISNWLMALAEARWRYQ
jgi:hypothetical protein